MRVRFSPGVERQEARSGTVPCADLRSSEGEAVEETVVLPYGLIVAFEFALEWNAYTTNDLLTCRL